MMRKPAGALLALLLVACSQGGDENLDPAVERGRVVYMSVCTACHNANPNLDGSLGPANAGATLALLEAKILHGEYPPGYAPKRPSEVMPVFANLADSIPDLHAFLTHAAESADASAPR